MKRYEAESCSALLDPRRPYIVRLDGHSFHTFTQGFKRPFDPRIADSVIATSADLLEQFHAAVAYCESDEISLVFPAGSSLSSSSSASRDRHDKSVPPAKRARTRTSTAAAAAAAADDDHGDDDDLRMRLLFGGRVQKIVSIVAGFCSARFNFHICNQQFDPETEASLLQKVLRRGAHFDARAFNVPSEAEAVENIRWRSRFDCEKNSKMMLAQHHYSPKELLHVPANAAVEKLLAEKGIDWDAMDPKFKFGTLTKKEQYFKDAVDRKTGHPVRAARMRAVSRSFAFVPPADETADSAGSPFLRAIVLASTWNAVDELRSDHPLCKEPTGLS